jgi:hypothetical protein
VGRCSAFSYSASRYSYSYSKTPESIQVDHVFRKAEPPVFGLFVNQIPIPLFEYEYRFTEYEYEKNQWYELPATKIPEGPLNQGLVKQHIHFWLSKQTRKQIGNSYRCFPIPEFRAFACFVSAAQDLLEFSIKQLRRTADERPCPLTTSNRTFGVRA